MNLSGLLPLLTSLPAYRSFLDDLLAGEPDRAPLGIYAAARPYLVAALAQAVNRVTVLLVARSEQARQVYDELQVWLPPTNGLARVQLLADPDALPYERIPWARETRQARMSALTALLRRQGGIAGLPRANAASESLLIVTSARGLMQKTLPPRELRLALKPLRVGQMFDMNESLPATTWSTETSPGGCR